MYETYFTIIRPIAYIAVFIFARFSLGNTRRIHPGKKTLVMVAILGIVTYIALSFVFGISTQFGHNSMNLSFTGILKNFWAYFPLIIFSEYIRSLIMVNVREKRKYLILCIVAIIFSFISLDNLQGVIRFDLFQQIDWFFVVLLPIVVLNFWFTYSAMHGGLRGNLIFALSYNAIIYFSPILPDIPRILDAIITYCIVFMMFVVYDSVEWAATRQSGIAPGYGKRRSWWWLCVPTAFLAVCVMFGIGMFPVMPVAVASDSMANEFRRGDLIYVERTSPDDLQIGNIVQYTMGNISVVHRIIDIRHDTTHGRYFIFQGDENPLPDIYPVFDHQIIGRVVAKTPFIGFPALLFQGLK
jgi:signal peptidase